mgnify:CR=1 FL=1
MDKNIIVTGGANGIGKVLVEKLVNEKANVGVLDNNQSALNTLKSEFPNIYCEVCDISNYEQVESAVNNFYEKFNSIDILVNNAGFVYNAPLISFGKSGLIKHDTKMWDKVIHTDLNSVFYLTVNVVEKMILKRTKGLIVNVSSISAAGNIGQSAYSAAKAGVNALTYLWSQELSNFSIRVAGIAPGFTNTETTINSMAKPIINEWTKKIPTRRFGEPAEIADGILFIIKNDFFNGKVLEIDGGARI